MYLVNREEVRLWLSYVIGGGYEVIGPTRRNGHVTYEPIASSEAFIFDDLPAVNVVHPYLMAKELKAGFDQRQGSSQDVYVAERPQIFVGIRECDMAAIRTSSAQMTLDDGDRLEQSQFYVFDCRELLDDDCFCSLLHEKDYGQADGVLYSFLDGYCLDLISQTSKSLFAAFLRAHPDVQLEQIQYRQSGWLFEMASKDQLDAFRSVEQVRELCIQHLPEGQLCVGCGRCTRHNGSAIRMKDIALTAMELKE